MLKNIDPVLTPELLSVLATMGHGDDLVLADANFPAASVAAETTYGSVIELSGVDSQRAARAILSVFPLDEHVPAPAVAHGCHRGSRCAGADPAPCPG